MVRRTVLRRTMAVAVAATFATAGLAVSAYAAEDPSFGNIKAEAKGSITVFKHETQSPVAVTGKVTDTADALSGTTKPVQGVVFKSFKFDSLPLTGNGANDSWNKLSAVDGAKLENACNGVGKDKGTPSLEDFTFESTGQMFSATGADGKATLSNLAVAAYLVCEVEAPGTVVSKAAPFIVTIPHPDTVSKKWVYDVTVYPKNTVGGIDKTIEAQRAHGFPIKNFIHWPVTVVLPKLATGEHLAYLIVEDPMTDKRFSEHNVESVKVKKDTEETVLTAETDYKYMNQGNVLSVGLTKSGLEKAETKQGGKLEVVFKTKMNALTSSAPEAQPGVVKNKANLRMRTWHHDIPNTPPTDPKTPPSTPPGNPPEQPQIPPFPKTPPESPEVVSNWGAAKIKKVDAADPNTPLAGAKFQIFSATDATAYGNCADAVKDSTPLTISDKTTLETNSKGEIDFGGLFVSDNVHPTVNAEKRCYIIVETGAPDGYVLPEKTETKIEVKIGEVTEGTYNATIQNTKTTVPGLPLTGANGRLLLTLLGTALIAIATGGWVVYRRKQSRA